MLYQPMSSPIMTTMLGCFALVACACKVALPPAKTLETASAPSVSFRTLAPKSMVLLSARPQLVPAGRVLPSSASSLRLRMFGNCHLRQGRASRAGLTRKNDLTLSVRSPVTQPPISLDDAKQEGCGQTKQDRKSVV